MEKEATVIVVLGTAEELNVRWLSHHEGKFPPFLDVICVENYDVDCYLSAAYVTHMCNFYGWRAVRNFKHKTQGEHPHGTALDLALEFVLTPFVFTIDSDCFVHDFSVFSAMLEVIKSDKIAAVGQGVPSSILLYPHPALAVYRTDVARKHGFNIRFVDPQWIEPFLRKDLEHLDSWAEPKKQGYCDVGVYLVLAAQREGYKVVTDFPVERYAKHEWCKTPFITYSAPGELGGGILRFVFPSGEGIILFQPAPQGDTEET